MRTAAIAAAITTMLAVCLTACGDDGGGSIDAAASIDAGAADAATPDASMSSLCQTMCDCASTSCGQDLNECLAECAQIPASVATCRLTHCGYAQQPQGAALHCPHVEGDPNAQGTPPDCIYELADAGTPDAD